MTISAKFAGRCPACGNGIHVGQQIEWSKGAKPVHTICVRSGLGRGPVAAAAPKAAPHRHQQRECCSGGNCSSFGAGRSCGGRGCDGWT